MSEQSEVAPAPKAYWCAVNVSESAPCSEAGGWPEFEVTVRYYATTEDQAVIDELRDRALVTVIEALDNAPTPGRINA